MTWADGMGDWEDGYNSGALRKASDAGLVDMNELVEIWKSKPIPEGADRSAQGSARAGQDRHHHDDRIRLPYMDADCAYNFMAGEALGFQPIDHDDYISIIEARKSKM